MNQEEWEWEQCVSLDLSGFRFLAFYLVARRTKLNCRISIHHILLVDIDTPRRHDMRVWVEKYTTTELDNNIPWVEYREEALHPNLNNKPKIEMMIWEWDGRDIFKLLFWFWFQTQIPLRE